MKSWTKALVAISLSLMCFFSCFGYAALSSNLGIQGTTKVEVPYGLFITSVSTGSATNVDKNIVGALPYSTTVDSTISRSRSTGTVTYNITVLNNTRLTYSYRGIYYQTNLTNYNGNKSVATAPNRSKIGVVCSLANLSAEQKKVGPGETLSFTVTYTIGSSMSASTDWRTLINFQFGINVDGEREALEVIESKFLNILNTQTTYLQLLDALDNKFDGSQEWTSNYIGNVKGSSSADSVAVNTLFSGQLQITVGKEQLDATVMIKHENLDGSTLTGDKYTLRYNQYGEITHAGCEMTLYLTIDPLNKAGAYVPVYAVVFTCDTDENGNQTSEWYRIGSTYAGTANVVTYDGGNGTGSFVTDNWIADAATYQLIEGYSFNINGERYNLDAYSHNIAGSVSIKDIVTAKDATAIRIFQNLLNDARRLADNQNYAGVGIDLIEEELEETLDKFSDSYTVDENGNYVVDPNLTIAQISPAILNLYDVVNDALIKIDELAKQQ